MHLEVLDGVLVGGEDAGGLAGELALLADDRQSETELPGQRGGEEETPGFDPGDEFRSLGPGPGGELVDSEVEGLGALDDGRDVLEDDSRLGKIRDVEDVGFEVDGHRHVLSCDAAVGGWTYS